VGKAHGVAYTRVTPKAFVSLVEGGYAYLPYYTKVKITGYDGKHLKYRIKFVAGDGKSYTGLIDRDYLSIKR
jgi:hypothetical protein